MTPSEGRRSQRILSVKHWAGLSPHRSAHATRFRSPAQRCSIHEEPTKGEFKPAGAIAAGKTRPGSIPVAIRREHSTQPKPFYLKEGWLETAVRWKWQHGGTFQGAAPFFENRITLSGGLEWRISLLSRLWAPRSSAARPIPKLLSRPIGRRQRRLRALRVPKRWYSRANGARPSSWALTL